MGKGKKPTPDEETAMDGSQAGAESEPRVEQLAEPVHDMSRAVTYAIPMRNGSPVLKTLDLNAELQNVAVISYVIGQEKHIICVSDIIEALESDEARAAGVQKR